MSFHVEQFTHEPFLVHSYLVWDDETRDAALFNVGKNPQPIVDFIASHDLIFEDLFQTHGFLEFMQGQPALRDEMDINAHMAALSEFWISHLDTQATMLNVDEGPPQAFIDQQVDDEDVITTGSIKTEVRYTPGGTPGAMSYYVAKAKAVFVGDLIYKHMMAPMDVPHAKEAQALESIATRILSLPEDTVIYPGRGETTTVAAEKRVSNRPPRPYASAPTEGWVTSSESEVVA